MPRSTTLNYEIQLDGKTYYPNTLPEFTPGGEEGRIDVVDGDVKYKAPDGIRAIEEIEVQLPQKKTQNEALTAFQAWANSKEDKDVYVIGRDGGGNIVQNYMFESTSCRRGKNTAFDRASKTQSLVRFFLMPKDIVPVV